MRIVSATPLGDGVHQAHAAYGFPEARWTRTFLSRPLDDAAFRAALAEGGLQVAEVLTDDGIRVRAVAAP